MDFLQDEANDIHDGSVPEPFVSDVMELTQHALPADEVLSEVEIDTLGEVGNICMGAAATSMYRLIDRRVDITAPHVEVLTISDILTRFPVPIVLVEVEYVEGIMGRNMLLLDERDVALITDILIGEESGEIVSPVELTDLHMSAVNEIMNQMIGASATVLSQIVGNMVNISTPISYHMKLADDISKLGTSDIVIVTRFDMVIEGLLNSQLYQIMPYDIGRELSHMLTAALTQDHAPLSELPKPPKKTVQPAPPAPPAKSVSPPPLNPSPPIKPPARTAFERPVLPVPGDLVDVRPLHFQSFDESGKKQTAAQSGIDTIYNIPLTVAAELGTTTKNLSEVLDFEPGVVFILDKSAGDPVEILVNGKKIARGEVVIIDDNYGVRITELPDD